MARTHKSYPVKKDNICPFCGTKAKIGILKFLKNRKKLLLKLKKKKKNLKYCRYITVVLVVRVVFL